MKKLQIDLKNCHGIHRLSSEISFGSSKAAAIYAPNGMMKTSLARTFGDLSRNEPSVDQIFPDRPSKRSISDQAGNQIAAEQVVVIVSYDEAFGPTEEMSTLLIDQSLRDEYEDLQRGIYKAKQELVTSLKKQANTKKDVSATLSLAFTRDGESFFRALLRIEEELVDDEAAFADIPYDTIFDDKIVALLRAPEFTESLAEYVARFNELLDASTYFSRDKFNYYNAETVTKALGSNGFFAANHQVLLNNSNGGAAIKSQAELLAIIADEKQSISEDAALRKTFSAMESKLNKNIESRRFWSYISEHSELLVELANLDRFNERVWKSYLKVHETLYSDAVHLYRSAEKRKKEIQSIAADQRGQWEDVIEIFNDRFFVPFTLTVKNKTDVVLGLDPVAKLGFEFSDGSEQITVERGDLLEVLSTGEKKALYILNVLFEVERRKSSGAETIFVVDDIADSFDYKNKYAIIQYLKDISEVRGFHLLALTHNFDFFRTLESRFVPYKQCLMAQRTEAGVTLVQATGVRNPFIKDFKPKFFADAGKRVAAIPFIRNLLEYTLGEENEDYIKLTSLLHWKGETADIVQSDLDSIFNKLFGTSGSWHAPEANVVEMIHEQADLCAGYTATMDIANKIALSISIRLASEKFMVEKIADDDFVAQIKGNQTAQLSSRFKHEFPAEREAIRTVAAVVLMTPENIHVNSFMYEPILDMSDEHLVKLLEETRQL